MAQKTFSLMMIIILFTTLLAGCGSEQSTTPVQKQPFYIQTTPIYNAQNMWYITKSAKVQGASEIVLTSMVSGKVKTIATSIGSLISNGKLLVQLQDTTSPFDKAVQDAQIAYQKAQLWAQTTKDDIAQQLKKIQYDVNNVNETLTGSSSQIQLAKLEKDLEKAEFDYQAKVKSDGQTNENLITSARNIQSDLAILLQDTVTETDKLLGITDLYTNGDYKDLRIYLWARDEMIKSDVTNSFYTISSLQNQLDTMHSADITSDNVTTYLKAYQSIVTSLSDHFVLMKKLFVNSIDDARYKAQLTLSLNTFTALQTKNSTLNASITSQLNSIRSYFASYGDQQQSLAKQIDSLRDQIAVAKRGLEDAAFNTNLWADRSKIGFDSQIKNADLTTQSAYLQLQQANFNQSKFSIISPLQGFVADVLVDLGQDVAPGTPLLKIVSTQQQIELTLTPQEVKTVNLWQKVIIESDLWAWEWTIAQISQVADKSGSFKIVIVVGQSTIPTGLFVTVKIPVQKGTVLLPLSSLFIVDTNSAVGYFRDGQQIINKTITIWSIFGDQIEITDKIPTNYDLITTDITNYDETTMNIVNTQNK